MIRPLTLFFFAVLASMMSCTATSYSESFDSIGQWSTSSDVVASGGVDGGAYVLSIAADANAVYATANEQFGDGIYRVETRQTAGTLDAGYGLMLHVDDVSNSFYLFEISSDGFVWAGLCQQNCAAEKILIGSNPGGWIPSDSVNTGLGATNILEVEAHGSNYIFAINGREVGRFSDPDYSSGDIGLFAETLGEGGITVTFDNVSVTPVDS